VVSIYHHPLANAVPPRNCGHCPDAQRLFDDQLQRSKMFTFASFVENSTTPIQKTRDKSKRMIIFHSAAPYYLSEDYYKLILTAPEGEQKAFLTEK
jgi:hypothetical protein